MRIHQVASILLLVTIKVTFVTASPMVNLALMGRVQGSNDQFSRQVAILPGQSVEYRVIGQMAPIGTSNTQGSFTRTITSLALNTSSSNGDGINALTLDLFQNPSDPVQVDLTPVTLNSDPTLQPNDSWDMSLGSSRSGTPTVRAGSTVGSHDLSHIYAAHSAGVRTAVEAETIFSGTFTVPEAQAGPTSLVRLRWSISTPSSGSLKINGLSPSDPNGNAIITPSTESGVDAFVGIDQPLPASGTAFAGSFATNFSNLSVNDGYALQLTLAPEPSSLCLMGLGAIALLRRRQRA